MENNCIFCKIINNEIPSYTIFENDDVKAFLDISQTTPGHTLVIPKKHRDSLLSFDREDARNVFQYIPEIARAIKASNTDIKGINLLNNNGEVAYQSVFHAHIHLIPRYSEQDDFSIHFSENQSHYTPEKYEELAKSIKTQF
ncbi:HIT family protein [Holzapfeliella floricola]|uniref:Histidine triad nucleotide-binding protein n=1 Tax=Holzapfeliella floricola DSM 23037 = JCM 16512 TaxID=1423744 RepID=A0A0R2DIQ0_9LACO|nr:HIT family protein [Holzapfeliella floricola]KRN03913.1 histidine triad nucleotide-binding protein [Holzapfeliella floricola DSM 23037 = JCM 16512]